jgi:Zn-dependent peptidase ImmA (M78 family)
MPFNPEMLILARNASGVSQKELARQMNWSQGKASKVENGLIVPSDEECQRLAFLNFPVDFFFSAGLPEGFGSCCTFHRKRLTAPIRAIDQLHDQINIRRIQVSRLFKSAKIPPSNFPKLDIDEFESPSVIAQHVRAIWKLPRGRVRNLVQAIEAAGGIVLQCDFPTPKIDAVSQISGQLPPFFFLNRNTPVDRWRRSLAHELGHIIMHSAGPSTNAEDEAEEFASEFLMPDSEELRRDLQDITIKSAASLKLKWRVSMQSLIMRAYRLRVINERRYRSLSMRLSQLGYRKLEPHPLEGECPVQLRQLIELHLHELGYSRSDLAKTMLCTEGRFEVEFLDDATQRFGVIG